MPAKMVNTNPVATRRWPISAGDAGGLSPPERHQADVSADADHPQADQENRNLNEPNDRAAVCAEQVRAGAEQEHDITEQGEDNSNPDTPARGSHRVGGHKIGCIYLGGKAISIPLYRSIVITNLV